METQSRSSRPFTVAVVAIVLVLLIAFLVGGRPTTTGASPSPTASTRTSPTSVPSGSGAPSAKAGGAILLAVGDIAYCGASADEKVGQLAARLPGTIALLGDNAYDNGSATDYASCFNPTWGGFLDRIRPVPGNHEYETRQAAAYFAYFGTRVGKVGEGWYSYDVGAWHLIALNSNCGAIRGGCEGRGSDELAWLVQDLAAHPARCTLAYWHHPRYSSGRHGDNDMTEEIWQALSDAGADVVLEGHDHDYERMSPVRGIRSFVVGTGGRSLYGWPRGPGAHTEVRANDTYGLLQLTLRDADYSWKFIPAAGGKFTDAGSATCR
jgi:alkaline phosphatase